MVTVAMPVRDEADRYLGEVLEAAGRFADRMVVLDDGSSDDSVQLATALGAEVFSTPEPLFHQEWRLRTLLWQLATAGDPDWVILLDADELIDPPGTWLRNTLAAVAAQGLGCVSLPLFDLWDDRSHYRDDRLWTAHRRLWPIAVRPLPGLDYRYAMRDHHAGRWPTYALPTLADHACTLDGARILHLGWLKRGDRERKYLRYRELDPEGRWGSQAQYDTILDPAPHLSPIDISDLRSEVHA